MAQGDFDIKLTPTQFRQLLSAREDVDAGHRLLDKLQAAGIDVTDARAELNRRDGIRKGLLQHFSPTGAAETGGS